MSDAVRDQFGGSFAQLGTLRRRRNELEYPAFPGEQAEPAEAKAAITTGETMLEDARRLIDHLGIY